MRVVGCLWVSRPEIVGWFCFGFCFCYVVVCCLFLLCAFNLVACGGFGGYFACVDCVGYECLCLLLRVWFVCGATWLLCFTAFAWVGDVLLVVVYGLFILYSGWWLSLLCTFLFVSFLLLLGLYVLRIDWIGVMPLCFGLRLGGDCR